MIFEDMRTKCSSRKIYEYLLYEYNYTILVVVGFTSDSGHLRSGEDECSRNSWLDPIQKVVSNPLSAECSHFEHRIFNGILMLKSKH